MMFLLIHLFCSTCLLFCFVFRSRVAYYGVFDGHAGSRASSYSAKHLHQHINSHLPKGVQTCTSGSIILLFPSILVVSILVIPLSSIQGKVQNLDREVKKCLLESFKKTDEDFLRLAADASPSWKDG